MNDLLFSDYGIEVRIRDGRLFIRYDAGRSRYKCAKTSKEEFLRAHQSEKDAHAALLSVQKKNDEVDRELRDSK
jgi:hypothetical protein